MFGFRALFHQGWKAVVYHTIQDPNERRLDDAWELYNAEQDPSECNDLASSEPDRLREMIELWWSEASRYGVLPLDNRAFSEFVFRRPRGAPALGRYIYYPDAAMVPAADMVELYCADEFGVARSALTRRIVERLV